MQVEWIKNLHAMRVGRENSSSWKESPRLKFCNTETLFTTLGKCNESCSYTNIYLMQYTA